MALDIEPFFKDFFAVACCCFAISLWKCCFADSTGSERPIMAAHNCVTHVCRALFGLRFGWLTTCHVLGDNILAGLVFFLGLIFVSVLAWSRLFLLVLNLVFVIFYLVFSYRDIFLIAIFINCFFLGFYNTTLLCTRSIFWNTQCLFHYVLMFFSSY